MPLPRTIDDVQHVFFINLDSRPDRLAQVTREFARVGFAAPTRFPAIAHEIGAIGCTMSHIRCLEIAIAADWDYVLICEDDVQFLNPAGFRDYFAAFMQRHPADWDVVLLAGNNFPPFTAPDETCLRVTNCQTTTAYLVRREYMPTLLANFRHSLAQLLHATTPADRATYAVDIFWKRLQRTDRWFIIMPLTVIQRPGYSDIEKKPTNYAQIMIDPVKAAVARNNGLPSGLQLRR